MCVKGEIERYICKKKEIFLQTKIGRLVGIVWNNLWGSLGGGVLICFFCSYTEEFWGGTRDVHKQWQVVPWFRFLQP